VRLKGEVQSAQVGADGVIVRQQHGRGLSRFTHGAHGAGDVVQVLAALQPPGDVHNGALTHAIHDDIGAAVEQHAVAYLLLLKVVMGQPARLASMPPNTMGAVGKRRRRVWP
jgi:hypothetical protein